MAGIGNKIGMRAGDADLNRHVFQRHQTAVIVQIMARHFPKAASRRKARNLYAAGDVAKNKRYHFRMAQREPDILSLDMRPKHKLRSGIGMFDFIVGEQQCRADHQVQHLMIGRSVHRSTRMVRCWNWR